MSGAKERKLGREHCFHFVGGFSDPQFLLYDTSLWISKSPVMGLRPDEPGCAVGPVRTTGLSLSDRLSVPLSAGSWTGTHHSGLNSAAPQREGSIWKHSCLELPCPSPDTGAGAGCTGVTCFTSIPARNGEDMTHGAFDTRSSVSCSERVHHK